MKGSEGDRQEEPMVVVGDAHGMFFVAFSSISSVTRQTIFFARLKWTEKLKRSRYKPPRRQKQPRSVELDHVRLG